MVIRELHPLQRQLRDRARESHHHRVSEFFTGNDAPPWPAAKPVTNRMFLMFSMGWRKRIEAAEEKFRGAGVGILYSWLGDTETTTTRTQENKRKINGSAGLVRDLHRRAYISCVEIVCVKVARRIGLYDGIMHYVADA